MGIDKSSNESIIGSIVVIFTVESEETDMMIMAKMTYRFYYYLSSDCLVNVPYGAEDKKD